MAQLVGQEDVMKKRSTICLCCCSCMLFLLKVKRITLFLVVSFLFLNRDEGLNSCWFDDGEKEKRKTDGGRDSKGHKNEFVAR